MISEEIEKRLQRIEQFVALPQGVEERPEGRIGASFGGPLMELPEVKEEGLDTDELLRKVEDLIDRRLSNLTSDVYEIINEYTSNENNFSQSFHNYVINTSPRIHKAFCKTDAPESTTIVAYLDVDTTGTEIEVNCTVFGGGYLDTAFPELFDGDPIDVIYRNGQWDCPWWFNGFIECESL